MIYSTFLGGTGTPQFLDGDGGYAIAVDGAGNAYVTGYTNSADFPLVHPIQSQFDLDQGNQFGDDAFVSVLNATGTALLFSTYLGGSGNDQANGIALDASNNIYLVGTTQSGNFPVTSAAFQTALTGKNGAFVAEISTPLVVTATRFVLSLSSGSVTAGTSINVTVTAEDAFNNTATAYAGTVHVTSSDGQASLPANVDVDERYGHVQRHAQDGGQPDGDGHRHGHHAPSTGTSSAVVVNAASANHFVVSAAAAASRRARP